MRFLSMIRIDETAGQVPGEQLMADMGKLIEELTRTGQLVSTAGLRPTSEGVRLRRGGKLTALDGPFAETKEVIGGYAILEAQSKAEAVELTRRFLEAHGSNWDIECEVRQCRSHHLRLLARRGQTIGRKSLVQSRPHSPPNPRTKSSAPLPGSKVRWTPSRSVSAPCPAVCSALGPLSDPFPAPAVAPAI